MVTTHSRIRIGPPAFPHLEPVFWHSTTLPSHSVLGHKDRVTVSPLTYGLGDSGHFYIGLGRQLLKQ